MPAYLVNMVLKDGINDNGLRSTSKTSLKSIAQCGTEVVRRITEEIFLWDSVILCGSPCDIKDITRSDTEVTRRYTENNLAEGSHGTQVPGQLVGHLSLRRPEKLFPDLTRPLAIVWLGPRRRFSSPSIIWHHASITRDKRWIFAGLICEAGGKNHVCLKIVEHKFVVRIAIGMPRVGEIVPHVRAQTERRDSGGYE